MPVGRKAKKQSPKNDVDVDALIEKGGSHAGGADDPASDAHEVQKITVRLPKGLVRRIDASLENRTIPISRNQWIAEAAHAALQAEEDQ